MYKCAIKFSTFSYTSGSTFIIMKKVILENPFYAIMKMLSFLKMLQILENVKSRATLGDPKIMKSDENSRKIHSLFRKIMIFTPFLSILTSTISKISTPGICSYFSKNHQNFQNVKFCKNLEKLKKYITKCEITYRYTW